MAEGLDKNSWFWIDSQDEFEQLVQQWSASDEIALDTEFHREKTYYPRLALLQVGWAGKVALIDPIKIDLAPLKQLFSCPVLVVLHAGIQDLEILSRVVGAVPAKIFDTQLAAGFIGYSNPSLALLSERILGIALPKGDRLTDWTKRPLSQSQLRYAASDVSNLIELKHVIEQDLIRMNRLDWALDESRILLERDRSQVPLERAWWKIRECKHLKGDSRKVAQTLAAWREERAARLDIPPRYVIPDLAIAVISQDMPNSVSRLGTLRGVEHRHLANGVDQEIINAVNLGRLLPDEALMLPVTEEGDKNLKVISSLATLWVGQLAQHLKVDPALLATRSDISEYLRGDSRSRLSTGWRNDVLGVALSKMARGELAVAVNQYGELELELRSHNLFEPVNRDFRGEDAVSNELAF